MGLCVRSWRWAAIASLVAVGFGHSSASARGSPSEIAVLLDAPDGGVALVRAASDQLRPDGVRLRPVARRALVVAGAHRVLRALPRVYARSAFAVCLRRADAAERLLAAHLQPGAETGLALLKRLNQWIGLCHAASGDLHGAADAFALAGRLPGSPPDATHFSPEMRALYKRAVGARVERCRLVLPRSVSAVALNGGPVTANDQVALGVHYATWREGKVARAARIRLDPKCTVPSSSGSGGSEQILSTVERRQLIRARPFIADLARASGRRWLLTVAFDEGWLRLTLFDAQSGRFVGRDATRLDPQRSTVSQLVQQLRQMLASQRLVASVPPPRAPEPAAVDDRAARPWYRRWWVWAVVGVVVGAAVAVPVAVTRGGGEQRYDIEF